MAGNAPPGAWRALPGPTGEANIYALRPREAVLCLAESDDDRLVQLAAVMTVGGRALWPADSISLWEHLPAAVRERVALAQDWRGQAVSFDAVLFSGTNEQLLEVQQQLAARPGPIVAVSLASAGGAAAPLERLLSERSVSINTAAAGGNASLMTIG